MAVYIPIRPRWNPRGTVINYVSGGQLCVRAWPRGYRDANTAAQRRQRGKMAQVCDALPYLKALLALGYAPVTKRNGRRVGSYHIAVAAALRGWFVRTPRGDAFAPARIRLTDGVGGLPEGLALERTGAGVRARWAKPLAGRGATLLLAAREPRANQWVALPIALGRGATGVEVRLPGRWRGRALEAWAAFVGDGGHAKTQTLHSQLAARPAAAPPRTGAPIKATLAYKGPRIRRPKSAGGKPLGGRCACRFGLQGYYCMVQNE